MFFYFSKLLSIFINPLLYLGVGFGFLIWRSKKKYPVFKLVIGLSLYLLLLISPLSQVGISYLENQYPIIAATEVLDAVVVLGGGSIYFDQKHDQYILGGHFPRFLEGLRIIQKNKAKYVVASGGEPNPLPEKITAESLSFALWLKENGVDEQRIIVEDKSYNTYQEAIYLKKTFQKLNIKKFYLVTSAVHMPRSMAVFKKQGFKPVAFPVGHLVTSLSRDGWSFKLDNIGKLKSLLHEVIGHIAYKLNNYL